MNGQFVSIEVGSNVAYSEIAQLILGRNDVMTAGKCRKHIEGQVNA